MKRKKPRILRTTKIIFKHRGKRKPDTVIDLIKARPPKGYVPREEYIKIIDYANRDDLTKEQREEYYVRKKLRIKKSIDFVDVRNHGLIDYNLNRDDDDYDYDYRYYIYPADYNEKSKSYVETILGLLKKGARIAHKWLPYSWPMILRTPIMYKPGDLDIKIEGPKTKKKNSALKMIGTVAESLGKHKNDKVISIRGLERTI